MYNIDLQCYVLVSGVQPNDSEIHTHTHTHTHIHILFHIYFHYDLLQVIQYASICYIVGPCCLSLLYTQ